MVSWQATSLSTVREKGISPALATIAELQTTPKLSRIKTTFLFAHGFCGWGIRTRQSRDDFFLLHCVWYLSWRDLKTGSDVMDRGWNHLAAFLLTSLEVDVGCQQDLSWAVGWSTYIWFSLHVVSWQGLVWVSVSHGDWFPRPSVSRQQECLTFLIFPWRSLLSFPVGWDNNKVLFSSRWRRRTLYPLIGNFKVTL